MQEKGEALTLIQDYLEAVAKAELKWEEKKG